MKSVLTMTGLALAISWCTCLDAAGQEVARRWATEFRQGTIRAAIRAPRDSWFVVTCGNPQVGPPSLGLELTFLGLHVPDSRAVQIVVDGKVFHTKADTSLPADAHQLVEALRAIAASTSRTFLVEVPDDNRQAQFSTANAREALAANRLAELPPGAIQASRRRAAKTFADACS